MLKKRDANRSKTLLENLNQRLDEKEYYHGHREGATSFSRRRKLTFKHLVVFLMNLLTKSLQKELNHFFKVVKAGDYDIREISKSAFTQARAKLKHTAFTELSEHVVKDFYDNQPWMSWLGRRVLSVDGSTMVLPDSEQLREVYGAHAFGAGERAKVISRISQLYDPLNDLIVHASLGKYSDSEKSLGQTHFPYIQSGDVVLFDRYYAAKWLFAVLRSQGVDFVCRLNEKWWKSARKMVADGITDQVVEFTVSKDHDGLLNTYGVKENKVQCRLIATELSNGEKMILCTSLLDKEEFEADLILDLYKKRWGVEESYKVLKCRLDLENFTGKTPHAILQDFYVKIFLSNLCSYLTLEPKLDLEERKSKKHPYKLNRTFALSNLKDLPIHLFLRNKIPSALKAFTELISKCLEAVRPGRKHKRRTSPRKSSKMHYKPI